jgi:geranylgeranyl diphosphate synthase type I
MNFEKTLQDFKRKFDREIAIYLDKTIKEAENRDIVITDAIKYIKDLTLAGGKRIRPALMYYGYVGAGGKEKGKMIRTAVSIELIHMFLLIHDDVIDRDIARHGKDSVNRKYEKLGARFFPNKDLKHFGNSMAIAIGDMVAALGNQIIFNSGFDEKLVMKALSGLQSIVSYTVIGEVKDLYIEYKNKASEKDVLGMYEYKTAKYTIEGPLHLGAIIGGAKDDTLKKISEYSIPVGIAFQIQDDILGIFGDEEKLGKKVGSDIKEGKITLLVVKAREKANERQKRLLNEVLGKKNLAFEEVESFREIIRGTGSLDYAKNLAMKYIEKGKRALADIEIKKETKDFLLGMADYMIEREL